MKTLKIEAPNGYEIDTEKSTFENIVFKEISNPMDEVYKYHNTTEEEFNKLYENLPKHVKAFEKECMVVAFYNKGWTPDFSNMAEYKYYPWFYMNEFSLRIVNYCCSGSDAPRHLLFKNEKDCREAVEKYFEVFKESRLS
jgi:hypothetical protein